MYPRQALRTINAVQRTASPCSRGPNRDARKTPTDYALNRIAASVLWEEDCVWERVSNLN